MFDIIRFSIFMEDLMILLSCIIIATALQWYMDK